MGISEDLNFNVSRFFDKLFNEYSIVTETIPCFISARLKALVGLLVIEGYAQTFTTTASASFDHNGVTNALRDLDRLIRGLNGVIMPRDSVDFRSSC